MVEERAHDTGAQRSAIRDDEAEVRIGSQLIPTPTDSRGHASSGVYGTRPAASELRSAIGGMGRGRGRWSRTKVDADAFPTVGQQRQLSTLSSTQGMYMSDIVGSAHQRWVELNTPNSRVTASSTRERRVSSSEIGDVANYDYVDYRPRGRQFSSNQPTGISVEQKSTDYHRTNVETSSGQSYIDEHRRGLIDIAFKAPVKRQEALEPMLRDSDIHGLTRGRNIIQLQHMDDYTEEQPYGQTRQTNNGERRSTGRRQTHDVDEDEFNRNQAHLMATHLDGPAQRQFAPETRCRNDGSVNRHADNDEDFSEREYRRNPGRRATGQRSVRRKDNDTTDDDNSLTRSERKESRLQTVGKKQSNPAYDTKKRQTTAMKPAKYDGTTSVDTFLIQFATCANYNRWDYEDKAANLKCCLSGTAGQILWETGDPSELTYNELVDKLKARYGTSGQHELFVTQLRARRRKENETQQSCIETLNV
jgi:hypothetical protein